MNTEARFTALLTASPAVLARVDAALSGQPDTPLPCLRLLKMGEAAEMTGLSRVTLWRAVRDGRLQTVEIRDNSHRISLEELRKFVAGMPARVAGHSPLARV